MAEKKEKLRLNVKARLAQARDKELPEGRVYVYDAAGGFLASAALPRGAETEVELTLPPQLLGRRVQVFVGPEVEYLDEEEEDARPEWMAEMLRERGELPEAPPPATLKRLGGVGARIRLEGYNSAASVVVHPPDWEKWLICWCLVRGRLVKRVAMPDGTTELWGVCHACILMYEVDAFPLIIAKLPDYELWRLRKEILERVWPWPPEPPEEIVVPRPRRWPPPPPPPPVRRLGRMEASMAMPDTGLEAATGSPAAEGMTSDLGPIAYASSAIQLRNALLEAGPWIIKYVCALPWFMSYFKKHLIAWACTDESGYFQAVIPYTCSGDHPDLYFRAVQCIGGSLHYLYDPGVRCHTHWNYPCGSEVLLETTDPAAIVCAPPDDYTPPAGVSSWVLINRIGGILIDSIGADGLVGYDFVEPGEEHVTATGAPFGGMLGFRVSHSANIPTSNIKYYRWLYRKDGTTTWHEFGTPVAPSVGRHYADYDETQPLKPPTFPVYTLGPKSAAGLTLYEFKPHLDELQAMAPANHHYEWPAEPIGNDIYSARLDSTKLPGGPPSAVGKYQFKLEVYDDSGTKVAPGDTTFRFIVLTSAGGDTRLANDTTEIVDDGFVFTLHVDNRECEALIDAPAIGSTGADPVCGFLHYNSGDDVTLAFHALHPASSYGATPANRAKFRYWIRRGAGKIKEVEGDVAEPTVGEWTGDYNGNFTGDFAVGDLLGTCSQAAFAEVLWVRAKATNGWRRLYEYDDWTEWAFALAPTTP
jgi:hypothetical protein